MFNRHIRRFVPAAALVIGSALPTFAGGVGVSNQTTQGWVVGSGFSETREILIREETGSLNTATFKMESMLIPPLPGQGQPSGISSTGVSSTSSSTYIERTLGDSYQQKRFLFGESVFGNSVFAFSE